MDRHDKVVRRDEGIFWVEVWGYHRFVHTNEAVSQVFVEGQPPSRTNMCK